MKNYIPVSRVEGTASRQAHCDLPEGTYEREMSKEGFFGPAAFFHHRHPPTGWSDFTGPLRPRALDLNQLSSTTTSPWAAPAVLTNPNCSIRYWRLQRDMEQLARNADGDDLMFVHAGSARLHCDFGHLGIVAGDYVLLPRGTMWRLETAGSFEALLIEATNASYQLPDKGLVGHHAIFDPALLDTPKIDEAFLGQQSSTRGWSVEVKKRGAVSQITYPFNPLDAVGWHGNLSRGPAQRQGHPSADEPSLPPAALGAHDVPRGPFRGLHVRAPAVRDRPGRVEGAVLPQQRRLRRSDLLSRR